jgi:WD40 repeat protein
MPVKEPLPSSNANPRPRKRASPHGAQTQIAGNRHPLAGNLVSSARSMPEQTSTNPSVPASHPGVGEKLKVFISYSRRDASEFADELVAGLELAGFAPFLDRHDIAAGEDWEARLGGLIGESDTVVFVVTPEAAKSERCLWEVERTRDLSKRILPVVYLPVPEADIPPSLARLQFIRFDGGRGLARPLGELAAALRLDLDWIREHTRLGELATRWVARDRPEAMLLRGGELDAAKAWAAARKTAAPEITQAQRAFLAASEDAENARLGQERAQLEAMRLAQQTTAHSQKRAARLLRGVAALVIAGFVYVLWQGYDVSRREVAVFSNLAAQAMNEGRYDSAMRYALQAYPARGSVPLLTPFSTELEGKLAGGAQSSRLQAILRGHTRRLNKVAFLPDGARVVTASEDDGTVQVWDVDSGTSLVRIRTDDDRPLSSVTLSPDGTRILASSADSGARLWDAATGRELVAFRGHEGFVNGVAFDAGGKRVATVSRDKTARIWDAATGKQLVVLTGHTESVDQVSFSGSGNRILTNSREGANTRVWDAETGRQIATFKPTKQLFWTGMLDPEGRRIVLTEVGDYPRIFDVDTGQEVAVLKGSTPGGTHAVFDRDGRRVLTSGDDIRIWDAATGRELTVLKAPGSPSAQEAAFDREEAHVVANYGDGFTRVWDLATGTITAEIKTDPDTVVPAALSADGKRLATASTDATARIWAVEDAAVVTALKGHSGTVYRAAYSPDGERVVTASFDATARIWDVHSGRELLKLEGHGSPVLSARFDATGKHVVTTSRDVRIWDAETGKSIAVLKGHEGRIETAAFDPAGKRVVSAGFDSTARIWDVQSGKLLATQNHPGWIRSAEFSPDGRWIATAIDRDAAFVWDAQSLAQVSSLVGHTSSVQDARFDRAGKRVLTGSLDGTARIWDATTGKELKRLGNRGYSIAQFNPQETRVVAGPGGGANILDVESGAVITTLGSNGSALAFSPDGVHVFLGYQDGTARIFDASWAINVRGTVLRDRVCAEKLRGVAQEFTNAELENPILRDIDRDDPIARNPCLRRGPLSFDYWQRLPGTIVRMAHRWLARNE